MDDPADTGPDWVPPREVLGVPTGLADRITDALALIGPDGKIRWANEACARLLRVPLRDLIGTDGVGRVHPDELGRALDGIAYASDFPDRTAVVPYRLRRGDGTYVATELKSAILSDEEGDHLLLLVRDGTTRTTLAAALASVAAGEPVEVTARWLAQACASRFPESGAIVVVPQIGGGIEVVAESCRPELSAAVAATWPPPGSSGGSLPWEVATCTGGMEVARMASLPSDLHALAAQDGYVSCVAVTAADGGNGWAGLVAFFDTESSPEYEFGHALVEIIELLQLAVKQREDKLELWRAARHDPLTGLYNRTGLLEWLAAPLARPGAGTAMLFVDLDGFKSVNDTHGHGVGDTVLRDVAGRLAEAAPDAVIARLGGDEFAIVVTDLPAHGAHPTLDALAERVFLATSTPVEIPDALPMVLGASIGITFVVDGDDAGRLLDRADRAMYEAKAAGGGWSFA